jgi:hypothetical protein
LNVNGCVLTCATTASYGPCACSLVGVARANAHWRHFGNEALGAVDAQAEIEHELLEVVADKLGELERCRRLGVGIAHRVVEVERKRDVDRGAEAERLDGHGGLEQNDDRLLRDELGRDALTERHVDELDIGGKVDGALAARHLDGGQRELHRQRAVARVHVVGERANLRA